MWPKTTGELLILLLFVVPGFVYQTMRIFVRGRLPSDTDLSTRIVRAIVSSVIFGLVYLLIFGKALVEASRGQGAAFEHPRVGAVLALLFGLAIPAASALVRLPRSEGIQRLAERLPQIQRFDPTPTGWDKMFQNAEVCFVRVLTKDGRWIAGFYGSASYATSYPEEQQLFLEKAFHVSENGVIGEEVENTRGVLVSCVDISLMEIVAPVVVEEDS